MNPQPLIVVHDVQASSRRYQSVLGLQSEFWLRDPEGYVIVVAGKYGDTGRAT